MGRVSDAKERLMRAVLELIWSGSYGSTTIDHICEKAAVKKGSFYYFFKSKANLAVAALEADWQTYRKQSEVKKECGCVLGCPLYTLGSEICTLEQELRAKIQEILGYYRKYVESAVRDAHAAGLIEAPDAAEKARMIHAYYEGLLTQARIQNDAEVLRELPRGVFAMLGKEQEVVAV